jgi:PKD domain
MAAGGAADHASHVEREMETDVETSPSLRSLFACLVLAGALLAVVLPAGAQADVRFAPALTSPASAPGAYSAEGVVGGNSAGVVAAAYSQKVGAVPHLFARVKPAGSATFGPAKDLSLTHAGSPAAAVAADGTATVAWVQANPCVGSSLWIATAPPGEAFGPAVKVSDNAFNPALAVAPDGTVVLAYTHDKGGCAKEQRVNMRPRSGAPSDVVISDGAYGSVFDAEVGVDAAGNTTVAFVQSLTVAPFTYVLRVARKPAGGAWTAATLSGPGTNGSALAVAPDGGAIVAYNRKIPAGWAVDVRSRAAGATVFGPPQTVTDTSDNETLSGAAIRDGGAAAVTTGRQRATVRPPGAASFAQTAPIGLPADAGNLLPVFTAKGELVFFDPEKSGAGDYSLVARVRQPTAGAPLGPPQPTGLTSSVTGDASLAPFGANNVAAGWSNYPTGASDFSVGVALGDGTPPAVGQVSAPAGGLPGAPLSFAAAPTDDLGIAGVQWSFGDGATAAGAATTHAFAAPGASTWSVEATDLGGNRAGGGGALTIQAVPQPPAKLGVRITRPRRGTRARRLAGLNGTASGPVSRVEVAVVRLLGGARASASATGARVACASLTATGRLAKPRRHSLRVPCRPTRYLKATGTRRWKLRLRRRLPAGRYAVWARARSASGAKSRVVRVTFTLAK